MTSEAAESKYCWRIISFSMHGYNNRTKTHPKMASMVYHNLKHNTVAANQSSIHVAE